MRNEECTVIQCFSFLVGAVILSGGEAGVEESHLVHRFSPYS